MTADAIHAACTMGPELRKSNHQKLFKVGRMGKYDGGDG